LAQKWKVTLTEISIEVLPFYKGVSVFQQHDIYSKIPDYNHDLELAGVLEK
jgi:hypothetical protein